MSKNEIYFIHGSKNSIDIDKIIIVEKMPTHKECVDICNNESNFDLNIAQIKNGYIFDIYKGTRDESNNSLLVKFI